MPDLAEIDVIPHSARAIPAHKVLALYQAQGWWPERTAEQVTTALDRGPAVAAWHGDRLVGFARTVTDGVLRAYLEDVVVDPDFRNAGLGRALVAAILDLLTPIPVVSLFCSTDLVRFYEASGFHPTKQVVLHRT
ncbi:GNAT family N-acetyltransferase [Dactylosporangium salmoneum]|uniref:GNAT family N-acetyltransferase n=1 Tax=Dactylosporangium salmoneum TaxID=53361 RepID=A0ABP5UDP1_9ACTN